MSLFKIKKITIYTDGSCLNNPGNGGWGAILKYNKTEKEISGNQQNTTNNQMELKAVIEALKSLKRKCEVDIFTDSQYVKNGMMQWIENWQKNNWKTANKKPVKNQELWQELVELAKQHKINWHWVKAHNGDEMNERVDKLARDAAENCQ